MNTEGSLLIVDDNRSVLSAATLLLERRFGRVTAVSAPSRIPEILRGGDTDAVLLDMNFSASVNAGGEGLYWLRRIKKEFPGVEVVLFTAYADIDTAVTGIKEGAADFVVKPWDNERLVTAMRNAVNLSQSRREVKRLHEIRRELGGPQRMLWGSSPAMERIRSTVEKVAATDASVLITGEMGTGKEMLAGEIHLASCRRDNPMVTVDMGAVPETLFESELFGHVKGAFTDARSDRAGKFEAAAGGTIFLDEIGNLPLHLQAKLLTAIQSRRVFRVGSNIPVNTDVRLVCATNREPARMVAEGTFREDLLYRINTIHIELPPLRERKADIVPLARLFLERYASRYGKTVPALTAQAEAALTACPWRGNIRELQNVMEKAVIMNDSGPLTARDLMLGIPETPCDAGGPSTLEDMEKRMIASAMKECAGNMTAVAQRLGITRQTLYNKIKRYGL